MRATSSDGAMALVHSLALVAEALKATVEAAAAERGRSGHLPQ